MKKIILSFLVLALALMSMNVVSFADGEAVPQPQILTTWDGILRDKTWTEMKTGSAVKNGSAFYPTDDSVVKNTDYMSNGAYTQTGFTVRNGYGGDGEGVTQITDGSNSYYSVNWIDIQSNYRKDLKPYISSDAPVVEVSYKINIPEASIENTRTFKLQFSPTKVDSSLNNTTVSVIYEAGNFTVNTAQVTAVTSESVAYTSGNWANIQVRLYLNSENKIDVGVYVNDTQIFYGTGTAVFNGKMYFPVMNFIHDDGDKNSTTTCTTYLDDITISTLSADYIPTDITETTNYLTYWDGVLRDSTGNAYADSKVINNGYSFYPIAGSVVSKALVARNNKVGTGVTHVKDGDNTYYSVNWEDVQSNYRTDIKPYMNSDAPVAAVSYKIQIPQESASKTRDFVLQFTNKPYDATTGVTTAKLTVKYDGKSFYAEPTSNLTAVTSEAVEYTPDSWTTVQVRLYLNAENKVEVGVYVGEQQIFYGTGVVDYSSNLTLFAMNFLSQVESGATYTTYLDDITVSLMPEEFKPVSMIKTTLEQNGDIVESKAEVSSIYNNLCLITAVYNSANKLEKIWVDDTIENGFLSSTVSGADYVKSGYKVKTFVFDSLQSAIPQVESIGLTID